MKEYNLDGGIVQKMFSGSIIKNAPRVALVTFPHPKVEQCLDWMKELKKEKLLDNPIKEDQKLPEWFEAGDINEALGILQIALEVELKGLDGSTSSNNLKIDSLESLTDKGLEKQLATLRMLKRVTLLLHQWHKNLSGGGAFGFKQSQKNLLLDKEKKSAFVTVLRKISKEFKDRAHYLTQN
ncbi:MAG: hypothetical protein AAFZ15_31895 [Bacteroidota bacterium]